MKTLLLILGITIPTLGFTTEQPKPLPLESCTKHVQYGFPQTNEVTSICRTGYLVGFDEAAKIPRYVAYNLTPEHAIGCVVRSNAFATDQSNSHSASPKDYSGTIYDRGHNANDGDMSWDSQVELESFYMTNMSPQAGSLNRGIWKLLESSIRGFVVELNQPYTIYVGSVYGPSSGSIGSGVVVPDAFYKIVINDSTKEIAGWLFPHVKPYPNLGTDLTLFRLPVDEIEKQSGVVFNFPEQAKELNKGEEWKVDFGKLTKAKQVQCSK